MNADAKRPTSNDDREAWKAYWTAQGMPWRTEPEIDEERQRCLRERRAVEPDIASGIYPFRDENGRIKLTRADVEWLLATHDGVRGPVLWAEEKERPSVQWRVGLDLRGADLSGLDLHDLPLARTVAGVADDVPEQQQRAGAAILTDAHLRSAFLQGATLVHVSFASAHLRDAHLEGADCRSADFQHANLRHAHLEGTILYGACLERAKLPRVHLERANLRHANFAGANLHLAYMDQATLLDGMKLACPKGDAAQVADVRWGGVNMAVVNWKDVREVGEEQVARGSALPGDDEHIEDGDTAELPGSKYEAAVRANRQLAAALRDQGLNEDADEFAYRAQKLQRNVLRLRRHWFRTAGSWLLYLTSGYGYRPLFSLITYLAVVLTFALAYYVVGSQVGVPLPPLGALVFSVTSFHGRGFSPGENVTLTNLVTVLAAGEAVIGLLIEIVFIATFTQRFLAR